MGVSARAQTPGDAPADGFIDFDRLAVPATERPPLVPPPTDRHVVRAPQYRDGGYAGLVRSLNAHTRWPSPQLANGLRVEGTVWVVFDVGADGRVYDARVAQRLHPLWDAAAVRGVRGLGEFIPGLDTSGWPATITLAAPVVFKLK